MAPAATLAVFLLCCCFASPADSQDGCDLYAATGTSITVSLQYTLKESDNLRWLKDATVIFMRRGKQLIQGKNDDIDSKGSLKLTQLTKDKSGRYKPEVHSADGVSAGDLKSMSLCVLDRVKKPTVKVTCLNSKKNVSFTCIAGQNEPVEWLMDRKMLAEKGKTLMRVASKVVNNDFSCNVSNPVSFEISLPVQQNCYESSFPDQLFGISIWVFVGGGAGVVVVLILIVIICCIRTRRKKQMRLKDEREFRLDYSSQEQHHHHHRQHHQHRHQNQNQSDQHQHQHQHQHPHHHHQQQPAGNTGPRQHRSKQQRPQQRPRAPEPPNGHPQPSPRRAAQATRPPDDGNEEQPPPLPQPRKKKAPKE